MIRASHLNYNRIIRFAIGPAAAVAFTIDGQASGRAIDLPNSTRIALPDCETYDNRTDGVRVIYYDSHLLELSLKEVRLRR